MRRYNSKYYVKRSCRDSAIKRVFKRIGILFFIAVFIFTSIFILIKPFRNFVIGRAGNTIWWFENELHIGKRVEVSDEYSKVDKNKNGIPDPLDIVQAARKEAENKTKYKDAYYVGGYPPEGEGVCTDVIWRGFEGINVNLKNLIDEDIKKNKDEYWRIDGKEDPNIDFRRVPNQLVFFQQHAISLTTEMKPNDPENLKEWQPGDIIVMLKPYEHVAIVSDKRNSKGMPYIIHNTTPSAAECPYIYQGVELAGHFRWKY